MTSAGGSPTAGGETVTRKAPRWMWIALIASLAVNVAVIGVFAGAGLSMRYGGAGIGGGPGPALMRFANTLPAERRQVIRTQMQGQRGVIAPLRKEVRQARGEVIRALQAEPFDKAAFLAAERRVLAADARLREAGAQALAEIAAVMTAEERRNFTSLRHMRRHGGPRGNADDDSEPPPKGPKQ